MINDLDVGKKKMSFINFINFNYFINFINLITIYLINIIRLNTVHLDYQAIINHHPIVIEHPDHSLYSLVIHRIF